MDSGLLLFLLTAAAGMAAAVAGVFVLAGLGWSLLAGGGALLLAAGFIRKGLTSG